MNARIVFELFIITATFIRYIVQWFRRSHNYAISHMAEAMTPITRRTWKCRLDAANKFICVWVHALYSCHLITITNIVHKRNLSKTITSTLTIVKLTTKLYRQLWMSREGLCVQKHYLTSIEINSQADGKTGVIVEKMRLVWLVFYTRNYPIYWITLFRLFCDCVTLKATSREPHENTDKVNTSVRLGERSTNIESRSMKQATGASYS